MEKSECTAWLIHWFQENTEEKQIALDTDFFKTGLLDSFKTLMLIAALESAFNLSLPDSALTDSKFSTIRGLSLILLDIANTQECAHAE